jgi:cadmium resistance protein CadD (predicted permease)
MDLSPGLLGVAIAVFTSTNIDDIVVVAAFFGDPHLRRRAIVVGQFLGIGALTAASAAAAYAALVVPPGWTSLLGLAPLYLGLSKLLALWPDRDSADEDVGASADAAERRIEERLHSQMLSVAAVTVANGGDNLGVYIPLFADNVAAVPLFAATFAVMTGLWCAAGYALVKNPAGAALVLRFGHLILPLVLIAIGVHILSGARVLFE